LIYLEEDQLTAWPGSVTSMALLSVVPGGGHEIVPRKGSAPRPATDSQPTCATRPTTPATAVCKVCGRPIRCERWLLAEWRHIE
jgi:hypothetical protein